jgi:hypothetical protein
MIAPRATTIDVATTPAAGPTDRARAIDPAGRA